MIAVIFVISMGLIGVLSLVVQNIHVQYINKNVLIASQLAQEGLELARNVRDNNFLAGNWFGDGLTAEGGSNTAAVYFDGAAVAVNPVADINDEGAKLIMNGEGFYAHGEGDYSGFKRVVIVASDAAENLITAACVVGWDDRGNPQEYEADTVFYDGR
jgi:hypothetical protein